MAANIWLEPETDGTDKVGEMKSTHFNGERIKGLISEFMGKLSYADWVNAVYVLPKLYYQSAVEALPINGMVPVFPKEYAYEVKARFDFAKDTNCIVLEVERFCRSRFYGIAYREIWVSLDTILNMVERIHGHGVLEGSVSMMKQACEYDYTRREENNQTFSCTLRKSQLIRMSTKEKTTEVTNA